MSEKPKNWIPKEGEWTFKNAQVAERFERHVREQLPWYELVTRAVVHIGRHYIPKGGLVYDVGASTGNVGRALQPILAQREAKFFAIEESKEMAAKYTGPQELVVHDALDYNYQQFDLMVCFLSLMFFPVGRRKEWINKVQTLIKPGGAIIVVDKLTTPPNYCGTVLRRLAMAWKLESGATPDEIITKELSLAGAQRPLDPWVFAGKWEEFFRLGEFVGFMLERGES